MIILLSPSKKLDLTPQSNFKKFSQPLLIQYSFELVNYLKTLSIEEMIKLMNISYGLAETNIQRYKEWKIPFTLENAKQAIFTFNGDVYENFQINNMNEEEIMWINEHFLILSGLYGLIKPLDLIQPYRLPMGTKVSFNNYNNLYEFWGDKITNLINQIIEDKKEKYLINLASVEYSNVVDFSKINAKVIELEFKEQKAGKLQVIGIKAKQARGIMANYIVKNKITDVEQLKNFSEQNYKFVPELSNNKSYVFVR